MATTQDNRVFVDTNILLAATDTDRVYHAAAVEFLEDGGQGILRLFACAQIFREYLVVATRPVEGNGLGLSTRDACENVRHFRSLIEVLPEDHATSDRLITLCQRHRLVGNRIHDANLVAVMIENGLRQLKTFNPSDFSVFDSITLL